MLGYLLRLAVERVASQLEGGSIEPKALKVMNQNRTGLSRFNIAMEGTEYLRWSEAVAGTRSRYPPCGTSLVPFLDPDCRVDTHRLT